MARKLTAWLSIGSTYSYLTAMRIKEVVKKEDINLSIIPISIRQIMKSMVAMSKDFFWIFKIINFNYTIQEKMNYF